MMTASDAFPTDAAPLEIGVDDLSKTLARMRTCPVSAAEVAGLRALMPVDGSIGFDEAEALFLIETAPAPKCAEWSAFFVEAMTDYVVWQARPTGVVTKRQEEWLVGHVDEARTLTAFAALINVLAEAHSVPVSLMIAALRRASLGWPGIEDAMAAGTAAGRRAA